MVCYDALAARNIIIETRIHLLNENERNGGLGFCPCSLGPEIFSHAYRTTPIFLQTNSIAVELGPLH